MIKKISAIALALVLCLSVVVMPASALELADGMNIAFELKWDKESYSSGETANLSVYMKAADSLELATGSIAIGLNSAVISQDDNAAADVGANAVASDLWNSYWKDPASSQCSWLNSTVIGKVEAKNTDDENALYDQYFKIVIARNTAGDHENAGNNKRGLPGADINALEEPIITFSFVVADGVADGTKLNAAITSGLVTMSPGQTAFKYYKSPGTSTTAPSVSNTTFDVTAATATSTIGETAAPTVELKFSDVKNQIRFDKTADGKYANTFDGRMVVSIDNLAEVVGADVNLASVQAKIKEIGFLYAKNGAINADTALAQIKGGAATYSVATGGGYISTGFDEADYAVTGIIHNIPDADKTTAVSGAVYAIYDSNGDGVDEYTVLVLNGGEKFTFESLYSNNFNKAFPA